MIVLLALFLLVAAFLPATLAWLAWAGSGRLIAHRTADARTSPADYGLAYDDVNFPSRDGLTLRGWFIPADPARGTVVFCHGHDGSMDPDVAYAPWFHEAGFNVLMFNFRAHGHSEGERVSMGYLERQDLLGAIDYLQGRGIAGVGVLGFSMGGAVGLTTAAQNAAIRAVASDGGFARLESALLGWGRERRNVPRWLAWLPARLIIAVTGWRLGVRLAEADPIHWVERIAPRPLLFIHGDLDPYVPIADVEALYAAAGEPKQLWRVPEAGHREVDKRRPAEYRGRVIGFFEHCLAAD
jgi:dipeptidyl aminopeptidase/acylaminoacyl peptidase